MFLISSLRQYHLVEDEALMGPIKYEFQISKTYVYFTKLLPAILLDAEFLQLPYVHIDLPA